MAFNWAQLALLLSIILVMIICFSTITYVYRLKTGRVDLNITVSNIIFWLNVLELFIFVVIIMFIVWAMIVKNPFICKMQPKVIPVLVS